MPQDSATASRRRIPLVVEEIIDFYDDSDDEKDHRGASDKMYGSACSMGQFFLNPCLCIFMMMRLSCQRRYAVQIRRRLKPVHLIMLLPLIILLRYALSSTSYFQPHPLRPRSDAQVNNLKILIHSLDSPSHSLDLGGWLSAIPFRTKPPLMKRGGSKHELLDDFEPLQMKRLKVDHFVREIDPLDADKYHHERNFELNTMDLFPVREKYDHDDERDATDCRRPKWKTYYFPNCNSFHEIDMTRGCDSSITSMVDKNYDSYIFSHGYYRDAWLVDHVDHPGKKESAVLKTLRHKHEFGPKVFGTVQRDAIIMERLTSSPYVVNVYGHCATSLTVEPVAYEIEEVIVPGDGYIKQEQLNDKYDVQPQNAFTPIEKLELALSMAESLAVLQGYEGGLIVHDDVQLCQWLRTRDGKLVLGDFNRAEIMDWNEEKGEYCKYNNGLGYGNYRAPEEFAGTDLNEKIDIFSFGNNVYALLTGLWVFYENEDDGFVQNQLIDGKTPFIDDRYRTRSYAEGQMVELMEMCWRYKPEDRPEIFEVVRFLRNALEEAGVQEDLERPKASNY